MTDHTPSGQQAVDIEAALRWADRHEARERQKLRDMGLPPEGDMPVPGAVFVRGLVAMLRTTAPTAPSTAAGEMAFVCGCGWDGSYADLHETVEGMTCPKCRLGRNLDCAAAPPAQVMKQPGPELDRAMDAALLRSAKIIEDVPWQEQAAQQCEAWALECKRRSEDAAFRKDSVMYRARGIRYRSIAGGFRALLSKPAKGEG